jgi:DMSO/TMAO reductase YedYZ molybdopterin-dependent catalytic subunit
MSSEEALPPGQEASDRLQVRHYGPIPKAGDPSRWSMVFAGNTADGASHQLTVGDLHDLPQSRVVADLHCAGKWSVTGLAWTGVLARDLLKEFPPEPGSGDVIVYGHYGYSASLRVDDLDLDSTLLATGLNDEPLAPEHGFPVRLVVPHRYSWKGPKWFRGWEYLGAPRRGFWEERGYHLRGDPWREERYSYQETHPKPPPGQRRPPAD